VLATFAAAVSAFLSYRQVKLSTLEPRLRIVFRESRGEIHPDPDAIGLPGYASKRVGKPLLFPGRIITATIENDGPGLARSCVAWLEEDNGTEIPLDIGAYTNVHPGGGRHPFV